MVFTRVSSNLILVVAIREAAAKNLKFLINEKFLLDFAGRRVGTPDSSPHNRTSLCKRPKR